MSAIATTTRVAALALGLALFAVPASAETLVVVSTLPGGATSVAVDGNYAYVARGAAGLDVVNRTNPANPVVVSTILPGDGAAVYIRDCAVRDGKVYLANWDDVANGLTGLFTGVYVYDVSNPAAPFEVSRIDWGTQRFYHQAAYVYDMTIADVAGTPYAFFVSEITNAVEIFNISNPALPSYAASLQRPTTMGGVSEDIHVRGNTAYVAWLQGGIASYDLTNLAAIEANNAIAMDWGDLQYPALLMQHKGAIGNARGLGTTADGLTLAVTDDAMNGKLRLFDVSNRFAPVVRGVFDAGTAADPLDVRIDGTRAYASWGSDGLRVIDVSNTASPVQIARYATPNAKRSALAGSQVLLADGTQGTLTLAFEDQVVIVTSTWSRRTKVLTVQATSTANNGIPPAVLTVAGRGVMTYSGTTGRYTFTQTVQSKPTSVTVTSSWGGSATSGVTQIR
jgi:hypothetical protein